MVFAALLSRAGEPDPSSHAYLDKEVFGLIDKELDKLESQEKAETGPVWPRPSSQVAYLLLQGLASQGTLIANPSDKDKKLFHLESKGAAASRLYSLSEERRLVKDVTCIQDKSGSYYVHTWSLFVRKEGSWTVRGSGRTASSSRD